MQTLKKQAQKPAYGRAMDYTSGLIIRPDGGTYYQQTIYIHNPEQCKGDQYCCWHRPSGHGLVQQEIILSAVPDRASFRYCRHGHLHWDPDSLDWLLREGMSTDIPKSWSSTLYKEVTSCFEGRCDGCCAPINKKRRLAETVRRLKRKQDREQREARKYADQTRYTIKLPSYMNGTVFTANSNTTVNYKLNNIWTA